MTSDGLAKMHEENARRLGELAARVTRDVFAADSFDCRPPARGTAIARRFRQADRNAGFADAITAAICSVYTEFGHPYDPATVRAEVIRQLDAEQRPTP